MQTLAEILTSLFGCTHSRLSRVFTISRRTYRVCCDCGAEFDYSLEKMSMKRLRSSGIVSGTNIHTDQEHPRVWVEAE